CSPRAGDAQEFSCGGGQYQLTPGSTVCTNCVAGKYKTTALLDDQWSGCVDCDIGRFSNAGATTCDLCPPGRFTSTTSTSSCSLCTAGRYSTASGLTDCSAGSCST